jgi:hypothetical protein
MVEVVTGLTGTAALHMAEVDDLNKAVIDKRTRDVTNEETPIRHPEEAMVVRVAGSWLECLSRLPLSDI